MTVRRVRPKGVFSAPFGLSFFFFAVVPNQIGPQDVAALIARQPAVTAHWRQHVRASAFGTIQAATFSFSRPIGTAMPQPLSYQLASLDPRMFMLGPWNAPSPPDDPPLQFPTVDRSAKGDRQPVRNPQKREPEPETVKAPEEAPVAVSTPEPEPAAAPAEPKQVEAVAAPVEPKQVEAVAAPAEAEQVEAVAAPVEAEQVEAAATPVEPKQVEAVAAPDEAEQVEAVAAPAEAQRVESAAAPTEIIPAEREQQVASAPPENSPAVMMEAEAKIETPEAAPEIPAAETPSTAIAAAPAPAAEPAAAETPTAEAPAAETPAVETPGTDIPDPVDVVVAEASDFIAPRPVEPVVEMARLYFGDQPMGDAPAAIEKWAPGEEPTIVAPQAAPADPDIKQSALDPKPQAADEKGGESIAPKGEVTGEGKRPMTPAERLKLDGKGRAKAEKCLANAVYFEARGEPVRGQIAVAQVVMNRVFSGYYPHNVCSTVYQNAHRRLACQFTFACDGIPDVVTEPQAWVRATRIARDVLDGKYWVPEVNRATHYHAYWVRPSWVREMKRLYKFGVHTFYRPRAWGDGSDAPSWGTAAATSEAIAKL